MAVKQDGLYFVLFPKQGIKLESVVLKRVCILRNFCPEQGQRFKTSAAHLHPSIGRVSPPGFVRFKLSYYMEVNRTLKSIAQNM